MPHRGRLAPPPPLLLLLLLGCVACACQAQLLGDDSDTASAARHDFAEAASRKRLWAAHLTASHSAPSAGGLATRQLLQEHMDSNAVRAGKAGSKKREPAKALVDALEQACHLRARRLSVLAGRLLTGWATP